MHFNKELWIKANVISMAIVLLEIVRLFGIYSKSNDVGIFYLQKAIHELITDLFLTLIVANVVWIVLLSVWVGQK